MWIGWEYEGLRVLKILLSENWQKPYFSRQSDLQVVFPSCKGFSPAKAFFRIVLLLFPTPSAFFFLFLISRVHLGCCKAVKRYVLYTFFFFFGLQNIFLVKIFFCFSSPNFYCFFFCFFSCARVCVCVCARERVFVRLYSILAPFLVIQTFFFWLLLTAVSRIDRPYTQFRPSFRKRKKSIFFCCTFFLLFYLFFCVSFLTSCPRLLCRVLLAWL